jgi:hypothetical protein
MPGEGRARSVCFVPCYDTLCVYVCVQVRVNHSGPRYWHHEQEGTPGYTEEVQLGRRGVILGDSPGLG